MTGRCRCLRHLLHGVRDNAVDADLGPALHLPGTEQFGLAAAGDPVELTLVRLLNASPPEEGHQRPDRQDDDEREDHERFTCRPVSVTTWPSCIIVSDFRKSRSPEAAGAARASWVAIWLTRVACCMA